MSRREVSNRQPRDLNRPGDLQNDLVGKVVRHFLERHPAFATNPLGDWQELVGEHIARYCRPQSLKKRVLTVTAHDSVWKHHLELLKGPLLEKINSGRPDPLVEKIVVRVGALSANAPPLNPALQDLESSGPAKTLRVRRRKSPTRSLTAEEKTLLKTLPDPELRAIGTRLLKRIPLESDG